MHKTYLLLMGVLLACNTGKDKKPDAAVTADTVVKTAPAEGSTARTALDVLGTYRGILPCADCPGTETVITLNADSSFTRSMKYQGKPDVHNAYSTSGKWSWSDDSTIQLGPIKAGPNLYFVAENKLIQLDMAGKRITGKLADHYILVKQ
jgi:uncharacterized lipoprotein NlpE involved in copper resistance